LFLTEYEAFFNFLDWDAWSEPNLPPCTLLVPLAILEL